MPKSTIIIKTTLKQNGMKMGIPPEHIPKSLVGYDHTRDYFFTGNFPVEIAYHGEYHLFRFLRKAFCRGGRIPAGPSERHGVFLEAEGEIPLFQYCLLFRPEGDARIKCIKSIAKRFIRSTSARPIKLECGNGAKGPPVILIYCNGWDPARRTGPNILPRMV